MINWRFAVCVCLVVAGCDDGGSGPSGSASPTGGSAEAGPVDAPPDRGRPEDAPPADGGRPDAERGAIAGQVLAPVGDAFDGVAGVRVRVGDAVAVTDGTGYFELRDLPAGRGVRVEVEPLAFDPRAPGDGLVHAGTTLYVDVEAGRTTPVFPKVLVGCALAFDAAEGAQLALPDGCGAGGAVEVDVPPEAWVTADGQPHTGPVRLELATLDPAAGASFAAVPGAGGPAEDLSTSVVGGGSFHALDPLSGAPLRIAPGRPLTVRVPVDAPGGDLRWRWYDPETGRFDEEVPGALVTRGERTFFEFEAAHFSTGVVIDQHLRETPRFACIRLRPVLEALPPRACVEDADCPPSSRGTPRPCVNGTCGCRTRDDCPAEAACQNDRCVTLTCSENAPCPDGRDDRPLACVDGGCRCTRDAQCPGDLSCVDNECVELNASVDVFADGRFWLHHRNVRGCLPIPADRDVELVVRYVNPLAVAAGLHPIYEWRTPRGFPVRRPALVPDARNAPAGQDAFAQACRDRPEDCAEVLDPNTGARPVLRARAVSCVAGRAVTPCGGDCTLPVEGPLTVRHRDRVIGVGEADPHGGFCATTFLTAEPQTLLQGDPAQPGASYLAQFTPQGAPGARCPAPGDPDWPVGRCQDLGVLPMECQEGNCLRPEIAVRFDRADPRIAGEGRWNVGLDASASTGPIVYYDWRIYPGFRSGWHRPDPPIARSATSRDPTWSVTLPTGNYTVELTVSNLRRFGIARRTVPLVLLDRVWIPTTELQMGCGLSHPRLHRCEDDEDCVRLLGTDRFCDGRNRCTPVECMDGDSERYCYPFLDVTGRPECTEASAGLHRVRISRFTIDRTEVTQAQYERCVAAGACPPVESCGPQGPPVAEVHDPERFPNRPVTCVTWEAASAFCAWRGMRLPTEAEWEVAARGAHAAQPYLGGADPGSLVPVAGNYLYPWGDREIRDCALANVSRYRDARPPGSDAPEESCQGALVDVARHPRGVSPFGLLDVAGNVAEWTADWYSETIYQERLWECLATQPTPDPTFFPARDCPPIQDPRGPEGPPLQEGDVPRRVVRGSRATTTEQWELQLHHRVGRNPDAPDPLIGFRCALSARDLPACAQEFDPRGPDCDRDRINDDCALAEGIAPDCDDNGRIDACDVRERTVPDCNRNLVPDACDIAARPEADRDGDGVLDLCEPPAAPPGPPFGEPQGVIVPVGSASDLRIGQLDGAGPPEIVVAGDAAVVVLELDAGGVLRPRTTLGQAGAHQVELVDLYPPLRRPGLDVLALGDALTVFRNRGDGTFDEEPLPADLTHAMIVGDFDGSNGPDVLTTDGETTVHAYLNIRQGELAPNLRPFFAPAGHANTWTAARNPGDAPPEIVGADARPGMAGLWRVRVSSGFFFNPRPLIPRPGEPRIFGVADLAGDGAEDVLFFENGVCVLPRVPRAEPGPPACARVAPPFHAGAAGDLDGDGDADVVVAAGEGLVVLENVAGALEPRAPSAPLPAPAAAIATSDLDEDGDIDVVAAVVAGGRTVVSLHPNLTVP